MTGSLRRLQKLCLINMARIDLVTILKLYASFEIEHWINVREVPGSRQGNYFFHKSC
jgi:hypothetical protein